MMKYLLILFFAISLFSCKNSDPVSETKLTKVMLLGYDMRLCACCGGQLLSFNLNAEKYKDTMYLINKIVKNDIITDTTTYPKIVNVEWKFAETTCGLQKVDISRIEE